MLRVMAAAAMALFVIAVPMTAKADVYVQISTGSQTMNVFVDGMHYYSWPVSTGRRGYYTPRGTYRAHRLERVWYSRKYDDAPMPYSIFFRVVTRSMARSTRSFSAGLPRMGACV